MSNTNLSGHSGCKIILVEEDGRKPYVRKYSSGPEYNKRLEFQCNKQKSFVSDRIKAPTVYDTGYTEDGIFYFDMEYVQGITLAQYMATMDISRVRGMVDDIVKNIVNVQNEKSSEANTIFREKIASLEDSTSKLNNRYVIEALTELKKYDWSGFGSSFCHGDLTLENIIVRNNELYLIDFLDSFYDSWILDIGKLMQDVQTMWSYRFDKDISTNTVIRLIAFRDILLEEICKSSPERYCDIYYALLLHLVRIYPYTRDKEIFDFLDKKVSSVLGIINECRGEYR